MLQKRDPWILQTLKLQLDADSISSYHPLLSLQSWNTLQLTWLLLCFVHENGWLAYHVTNFCLQEMCKSQFPGDECFVLPYLLYSDESVIALKGFKFHTLVLFLAQPLQKMRALGNHIILAYLPVVGSETGLSGGKWVQPTIHTLPNNCSLILSGCKQLVLESLLLHYNLLDCSSMTHSPVKHRTKIDPAIKLMVGTFACFCAF